MKTIPIKSIVNDIQISKLDYPYPKDKSLPSLFFNLLAVGSRGSGKTTAITKLLKAYENSGLIDPVTGMTCAQRIIVISPTYSANKHIFSNLQNLDEDDVYNDYDDSILQMILSDIRAEKKNTEEYMKKLQLWYKFKTIKNIDNLSMDELVDLEMMNYEAPSPNSVKYPAPTVNYVVIDDMVGNAIYKQGRSYFKSQLIKNRHDRVCYILCSQSLKAIPKDIRINCSIFFLWRFNNSKINEEIHEEISNKLTMTQFEEIYEYSTEDEHDYLVLDFTKKKNEGMFNKSFKEVLLLE